jgi:hypothetical protein
LSIANDADDSVVRAINTTNLTAWALNCRLIRRPDGAKMAP